MSSPKRSEPAAPLRFPSRDELRRNLRASLRRLMEKRGFTYQSLADRARVNKRQLEEMGRGRAFGSPVTQHRVAIALRVNLDELFKPPEGKAPSRAKEPAQSYGGTKRPPSDDQLETLLLEAKHLDGKFVDLLIEIARGQKA